MKYVILILIISSLLFSCTDRRKETKRLVQEKMQNLDSNKEMWNKLNSDLLNNSTVNNKLGKYIKPSEFNDKIKTQLTELGIIYISIDKHKNCKSIEYTTNWGFNNITHLQLEWTTCDSIQTKRGYYLDNFDKNFIEVWGAGNNWLFWSDADPI